MKSIFSTLLSITLGLFITLNIAVVTDLDTKIMDYVLSDAEEVEASLGWDEGEEISGPNHDWVHYECGTGDPKCFTEGQDYYDKQVE